VRREPEAPVEAIVVGSGASGGFAAKALTAHGLRVLLLEAGRALDERADFPHPAPDESPLLARARAGLAGQAVQMRCPAFNARTQRFFVDDRENPYTTPPGQPFNWFRGRQVGGRLHAWARVAVRLTDLELAAASRDGHGVDWPLSYAELEPYYDEVESFLRLDESAAPNAREQAFATLVEAAFPERRVLPARLVRHDNGRTPPALRAAQATGLLALRPDAVVERVTVDPASGRATGVAFVDRTTRRRTEARAELVVLCASTIETLRILLNSACRSHPRGLGNSSGRLGQGLMDHVLVGLGGPLPDAGFRDEEDGDPYDFGRVTGFAVPRFRNVDTTHPGFLRGYSLQGAIGRGARRWYLLAHGEMLARSANTVILDPRRRDAWGIPAANIRCGFSTNETAMAADALATIRELAAVAGLRVRTPPSGKLLETAAYRLWRRRVVGPSGAFLPGSAIHETGGAPLGDDPVTSVLNRFGQCWDAPNVVVADGACFPSGCSQNVTLTLMALATRACDHVARRYRAGQLTRA